jgi:hypothetical protein
MPLFLDKALNINFPLKSVNFSGLASLPEFISFTIYGFWLNNGIAAISMTRTNLNVFIRKLIFIKSLNWIQKTCSTVFTGLLSPKAGNHKISYGNLGKQYS